MIAALKHTLFAARRATTASLVVFVCAFVTFSVSALEARASTKSFDYFELPLETVLQIIVTANSDSDLLEITEFRHSARSASLMRELRRFDSADSLPSLIFINGMRVDPAESRAWLSSLRASWVARVEIIRGNATVLWGPEAERDGVMIVTLEEKWGSARARVRRDGRRK